VDSLKSTIPDTLVKIVEINREGLIGKDEKITTVKGTVTDSKSGQPIAAKLNFKSDTVYSTLSGPKGGYSIKISSVDVYSIVVEAAGYVGVLEKPGYSHF